jgi:hypothetical protein
LDHSELAAVLVVINQVGCSDLSIGQIWVRELDADRGTSMTSQPVSALLVDLDIPRTHSRPRVWNDNPFSEGQFKTLKYLHDFPGSFPSLAAARAFLEGLFTEYDTDTWGGVDVRDALSRVLDYTRYPT